MKKTIVFLWLVMFSFPLYSYTWIPFCPDTINATDVCFGVGSWKGVICCDEGMYIWEDDIMEWSFYTYAGMPVLSAAYFDATKILVVMSDGSWSDGVYTFDLESKQFENVDWMAYPNFLKVIPVLDENTNLFTNEYYIGCQFNGLYRSTDGLTWTEVSYFNGKSCSSMDYYDNHVVIAEVSNIHNIYVSDDYGYTWEEVPSGSPMITDFRFSFGGDLYGIFPSYSNSSGLYSSPDFGLTWDLEFYSDNMSAVGYDAMGTVFVGWESPTSNNEGIAIYTPGAIPPYLSYLNEGLPNTHINKIMLNPTMSAIAIFCCTDAGVYVCYDYMVGEEENIAPSNPICIYPNPVKDGMHLYFNTVDDLSTIEIFNNQGVKVDELKSENSFSTNNEMNWNKGNLPAGVYYLLLKTPKETWSKKFIIL
ncbi:MAG: T9SS type A sorting domain-containing protein [Bacteroidales bacterium]